MTLHAERTQSEHIKVHITYGPVTAAVEEHEGHVASFWSQLGRMLAESKPHREALAKAAYERYREHTGGVGLAHGDPLPSWEDNEQKYRDAWEHAVAG